jgi:hypothetical protein
MVKEIILPVENDVLVEKTKIISLFDSFFNNEFSFDFVGNQTEIRLVSLDFNFFQHTANKILSNGS